MPLKYIGKSAFILGLPAQDLTDDDIQVFANRSQLSIEVAEQVLIERGLYARIAKPKPKKTIVKEDE